MITATGTNRIPTLDGWRGIVPLLAATGVYVFTTGAVMAASIHAAGGHFVYALDDTYINMAMAKHFALQGIWGVTPYQFSSSTSSPLYVLLLSAAFYIFGPTPLIPLTLSWLFGLASIYVAAQIVKPYLSGAAQSATLAAFVLFTPLFAIGLLGMEHSLHLFLTLLFLRYFDEPKSSGWIIGAITALMTATRYEGLFFATAGVAVLLLQRKWPRAITVAASAAFSPCVYAYYSLAHHGYWLPNSVTIKGLQIHRMGIDARIAGVFYTLRSNSFFGAHVVFLLAACATAAYVMRHEHPLLVPPLAVLCIAGCIHLATADIGWAYRYEDYLVGSGIILAACALPDLLTMTRKTAALVVFLLFCSTACLMGRSLQAATMLPEYSRTIYLQQWQMGRFLAAYYPGAEVAANDIGVINFRANLHCLDLIGLADAKVFSAERAGDYTTQFLDEEAVRRGIDVAVLYDPWFSTRSKARLHGPDIPASWTRVERWSLPYRPTLGDRTVSFYAPTAADATRLRISLDAFDKTLPAAVVAAP